MSVADAEADAALLELLQLLKAQNYEFTTPTPLTHSRVLARGKRLTQPQTARGLVDIFGWSLPFEGSVADSVTGAELLALMRRGGVLAEESQSYRSTIRVSSLAGTLFIHSAYPTVASDSVFFGPDTYRFVHFVKSHLPAAGVAETGQGASLRCADIGCGSGAGAIAAARCLPGSHWLLTDINPSALRLSAINARFAGLDMETLYSDVLAASSEHFDLIISNPPYLADEQRRAYRHGGADLGRALSLRIVMEACQRLRIGGRLLLYSGVAIVDGEDLLLAELRAGLDGQGYRWHYEELDPDVFGEELERPAYALADRIAAVGLVVDRVE